MKNKDDTYITQKILTKTLEVKKRIVLIIAPIKYYLTVLYSLHNQDYSYNEIALYSVLTSFNFHTCIIAYSIELSKELFIELFKELFIELTEIQKRNLMLQIISNSYTNIFQRPH